MRMRRKKNGQFAGKVGKKKRSSSRRKKRR